MEGAGTEKEAQAAQPARPGAWLDLRLIAILLVVAAGVRIWVVARTEVPARDSIGYIRYAWRLQHEQWAKVMRESERHPGYPISIYLASIPIRHFFSAPDALEMQLSAQIASSVAGVLLVLPMYFLGRALFDRTVGFWSALLFQCLPESGLVLSDGLSESVFLLFAVSGLLMAVHALQHGSLWRFAWCGLFGGLAFLTRPEGGLIVAITGLVLLAMQLSRAWRRPWRRVLLCGGSLMFAAVLTTSPFFLTIRRPTTQPSSLQVIEDLFQTIRGAVLRQRAEVPRLGESDHSTCLAGISSPRPMLACTFAVWWHNPDDPPSKRVGWGMRALLQETIKGFHYVTWLPALLGLCWFRDRLRVVPGAWVILILCALIALALWRVAVVVGYMSDRHTLLIVCCGTFWGVAGTQVIGRRLAELCHRFAAGQVTRWLAGNSHYWSTGLFLVLIASGLPRTLAPLHADRAGHRTAGLWLAEHAGPSDIVDDPFCWAHFYAGKVFLEGLALPPFTIRYIVLEKSKNPHSRLPSIPELRELAKRRGTLVYHCPLHRAGSKEEIEVFAVPNSAGTSSSPSRQ